MKNFLHIGTIDPTQTLAALASKPDLWNENNLRTSHMGTAHADADDIWLMFNRVSESHSDVANDIITYPYRAWDKLPELRTYALDLMRKVGGIGLGRVIITRLPPGGRITPHIDEGAPATFYTRYQIVLQSLPGAIFRIGDETMGFPSGSVWWINNRVEHEVINNSADDRIVCIVDVRLP